MRARLVAAVIPLVLVAACSSGGSSDGAAEPTTSTTAAPTTTEAPTTTAGAVPDDRPFDVRVPPGYEEGTPAPLLVLLHGYGATGQIQGAYLGLDEAADAAGMLYVHPDGVTNKLGKQYWNATDACCAPRTGAPDDSAYLAAVIAQVRDQYDVDPRRIYVMGHSNGGFMSFRMACDHADVVAAIVSLEAATFDDPADCAPSEPVAVLAVHGTADRTIEYDGDDIAGRSFPSAPTTVETWAGYNGCATTPDDPTPAPAERAVVADLPKATVTSYTDGCDPGGAAELWTQPDGVHIPRWDPTFKTQVLDWLLAHPKPA